MSLTTPMKLTRRTWLAAAALPLAAQNVPGPQPPEWTAYPDPSTESEVLRITPADSSAVLPAAPARAFDRRGRNLLYCSNRNGSWQAYLFDLGRRHSLQLTGVEALDPVSATLAADDRAVLFAAGPSLISHALSGARTQEIYRVRDGWTRSGRLAPTDDATSLFFVESREATSQLRRLRLPRAAPETVAEQPGAMLMATPNPRRATVFWLNAAGELFVAAFDGAGQRRLETPAGRILQAHWAPDGQSILYLLAPAAATELNSIREQELDSRADVLVARTSQFAAFGRNANGTVFVGASRSKASPNVLLLLRLTRREFTLCEHHASDPPSVAPAFAPNSQRIVFQSDRLGQPALYLMNVERLIEKTDS